MSDPSPNPYYPPAPTEVEEAERAAKERRALLGCGGIFVIVVVACGGCLFTQLGHEKIATHKLARNRTLNIYAEGSLHYEPPGFLYYEIIDSGRVVQAQRRFIGIGSERTPAYAINVVQSTDQDITAIVVERNIVAMYQHSTGLAWPHEYLTEGYDDYAFAEEGFDRQSASHPELRCERLAKWKARQDKTKRD